jgi:hypothetical protein
MVRASRLSPLRSFAACVVIYRVDVDYILKTPMLMISRRHRWCYIQLILQQSAAILIQYEKAYSV